MSKPYNGHKNWNHWNVSLWINNDEGLYNLAKAKCSSHTRKNAAEEMFITLKAIYGENPKTPDGAPYSVSSIRAAMVGM